MTPEPIVTPAENVGDRSIDLVAVYQSVLRVLVYLQEGEYTSDQSRQTEVKVHSDLPNPASENSNSQG